MNNHDAAYPNIPMTCRLCKQLAELVDGLCSDCQEIEEVMLLTAPTEQQMESMAEAS
jgi:hypothetical protein